MPTNCGISRSALYLRRVLRLGPDGRPQGSPLRDVAPATVRAPGWAATRVARAGRCTRDGPCPWIGGREGRPCACCISDVRGPGRATTRVAPTGRCTCDGPWGRTGDAGRYPLTDVAFARVRRGGACPRPCLGIEWSSESVGAQLAVNPRWPLPLHRQIRQYYAVYRGFPARSACTSTASSTSGSSTSGWSSIVRRPSATSPGS